MEKDGWIDEGTAMEIEDELVFGSALRAFYWSALRLAQEPWNFVVLEDLHLKTS